MKVLKLALLQWILIFINEPFLTMSCRHIQAAINTRLCLLLKKYSLRVDALLCNSGPCSTCGIYKKKKSPPCMYDDHHHDWKTLYALK